MEKKFLLLTAGLFLVCLSFTFAQEKLNIKYGKVTAQDFDLSKQKFDTGVHAIVLADIGSTTFEGNTKGSFTLVFKRHKRVKILNKSALDIATTEVPLYSDGIYEENLESLRGTTYNLENGKVVETKLDNGSVFKDKNSKHWVTKKFTMPAVKEGSIFEYTYVLRSDFTRNLQSWTFQGEYPCLWSEYEVGIPEFFNYVTLGQGYLQYYINKKDFGQDTYSVMVGGNSSERSERVTLNGKVNYNKWVIKDVPALKEESYTSTINNHVQKIEFQLALVNFPGQAPREIMSNWEKVADVLLKEEDFGANLARNNNWLDDDIKTINAGVTTKMEKAHHIFDYVRDNFTCTKTHSVQMDENNSLRSIFKAKSGSVAEINLLLTAMLKHEGITADPIILSTRDRGVTHHLYPLLDRFNYVICLASIDNADYLLDASEPVLGFGRLDAKCYNGHGRLITTVPDPIFLVPDSLQEKKLTSVFMFNNDKGDIEGACQSSLGYFESTSLREKIKSKGTDDFFKSIKAGYGFDINLVEKGIDSIKKYDDPVKLHYTFSIDKFQDDIVYLNPMMTEGYKSNPFSAAERFYPVEMTSTFDETYTFNMEIPAGYVVDELPKSAKVGFNDGDGYFEYMISKSDTEIQLRSRIILNRATFAPDEYQSLREFFSYIVKKHGEQIVLKKKKS